MMNIITLLKNIQVSDENTQIYEMLLSLKGATQPLSYERLLWERTAFQVNTNFKKCFKLVFSCVISTTQNTSVYISSVGSCFMFRFWDATSYKVPSDPWVKLDVMIKINPLSASIALM